jgi:von Willebrand factor type A domain
MRPLSTTAALVVGATLLAPGCKTRLLSFPGSDSESAFDASVMDAPATESPNCGVQSFPTIARVIPDLLILQDRSGSMNNGVSDNRNPPAGQSKWDLIRPAIEQVVASDNTVDWGLMLFGTDRSCGAPTVPDVPVGAGNGAAITQTLDGTTPQSSTPTTLTVNNAVRYYATVSDGHPHYLLLATDGEPTCANGVTGGAGANDDAAAEQAVADAASAGIDTFVVGIGATTGADQALATMATNGKEPNTAAGGRPYYSVSSTADLVSVLQSIEGKITPCMVALEKVPSAPNLLVITGSAGVIARDTSHLDGWDYGPNDQSVIFYGAACDQLHSGVVTDVEAIFECPPAG